MKHNKLFNPIMICSLLITLLISLIHPTAAAAQGITITAISVGGAHACALTSNGGVKCWGGNSLGQLGNGNQINSAVPVDVVGLASGVSAIAAGYTDTCALTSAGGVKCWGGNADGQIGDGTKNNSSIPVDVFGLSSGVSAIAAADDHICALTTAGEVKCWGPNDVGQLGDGTTNINSDIPVDVSGLTGGIKAISAGGEHTSALTMDGGIKSWGINYWGQLGDGTTISRNFPVAVAGLSSGISAISAGWGHTCAVTFSGGVKCWGVNTWGQLGDGTTTQSLTPVDVNGLTSKVRVIAAGVDHTCALTTVGGVKCWGSNYSGELGDGTTTQSLTPVDVSGLASEVSAISSGYASTCALTSSGQVKCWGYNTYGELGDGTTNNSDTPVDVVGLTNPPIGSLALVAGTTASDVYPGDPVPVGLTIQNANDLYAAQATCSVDPTVLQPQNATFGTFFDPVNNLIGANQANATAGTWLGGISQRSPALPLSGDGLFATVNYLASGPGTISLSCVPVFSDRDGLAQPGSYSGIDVTVFPFATVSGNATAQGRVDYSGILITATGRVTHTFSANSSGNYTVGQLKTGDYTIQAVEAGYIPNCTSISVVSGQSASLATTHLKGGDVNGDENINIGDATLVAANFGLQVPPADTRADINGDNQVNIQDLAILGGNFGLTGCQGW